MRVRVAEAAIEAGAVLVNDVSGGLADPAMASVVAETGVRWVLTHWRGHSRDMYDAAHHVDVVAEVRDELKARVDGAVAAGVVPDQLILDPGLGFAKHPRHDLAVLAGFDAIVDIGLLVLVGASCQRFLGAVLADEDGVPREPAGRRAATIATTVLAARAGAWGVRVHDVARNADAVRVVASVD